VSLVTLLVLSLRCEFLGAVRPSCLLTAAAFSPTLLSPRCCFVFSPVKKYCLHLSAHAASVLGAQDEPAAALFDERKPAAAQFDGKKNLRLHHSMKKT
jgi:hypothetical protein